MVLGFTYYDLAVEFIDSAGGWHVFTYPYLFFKRSDGCDLSLQFPREQTNILAVRITVLGKPAYLSTSFMASLFLPFWLILSPLSTTCKDNFIFLDITMIIFNNNTPVM